MIVQGIAIVKKDLLLRFPDSIADEYTTDYDLAAVTEAVRR